LEEYRCDYIGYNSLYKDKISDMLIGDHQSEVRVRISGRTKDKLDAIMIANEVEALYTNGPAGGAGAIKRVEAVISVCSIFVSRENLKGKGDFFKV
jgi:hypothetical protein